MFTLQTCFITLLSGWEKYLAAVFAYANTQTRTGKAIPSLAILYSRTLNRQEIAFLHKQLAQSLGQVQLLPLNEAPLIVQYEAISDNQVLAVFNRQEYLDFWETTVQRYLEYKPLLEEWEFIQLESLVEVLSYG